MAKIHITLVGGQAAPVYNGIKATKADKVIYIFSEDSKNVLDTLLTVINLPYEAKLFDPVQPEIIKAECLALAEKYKVDEVTVNISSGTKAWAYFFSVIFDAYHNAATVYIDQNNVLWNYRDMSSYEDFEFDMHMHFKLYRNELKHYTHFSEYTIEDEKAVQELENLRRFEFNEFKQLLSTLDRKQANKLKNQSSDTFKTANGSFVEWTKETNCSSVHIRLVKKNGKKLEKNICSPHAVHLAFNSGWFDYKVASILAQWEKTNEICLNCRFPSKKNIDKNEVDIIVNTGTKILFVECKTQIYNNTDVDKFSSVIKTYGGSGSKGLFVTQEKMDETALNKCKDQHIITFSLADVGPYISVEKALALVLDHEIYNINT